jgi:hypothetical protein
LLKVPNRFKELSRDSDNRTKHSVQHYRDNEQDTDDEQDFQDFLILRELTERPQVTASRLFVCADVDRLRDDATANLARAYRCCPPASRDHALPQSGFE